MKMMVKLAVLLATLLLLTGVAFAFPTCDYAECYEVTSTILDNPAIVMPPFFAKVCLVYEQKIGKGSVCGEDELDLSLFFDSMRKQALAYGENCVEYFKFHGDNNHMVTGIAFCGDTRFTFQGHKTDWDKCNCF